MFAEKITCEILCELNITEGCQGMIDKGNKKLTAVLNLNMATIAMPKCSDVEVG